MKTLLAALALFSASNAFAVEFTVMRTWKCYNQREQDAALEKCKARLTDRSVCSTDWNEHGGAVYDVALLEAASQPTEVVAWYRGTAETQAEDLADCREERRQGEICVTSVWIHKGAAYDVARMK